MNIWRVRVARVTSSPLASLASLTMLILGIETSCDETSASLVKDGRKVVRNVILSSKDLFEASGGVIPEEAARTQVQSILPVINACLHACVPERRKDKSSSNGTSACRHDVGVTRDDIDAIAVTRGPGLLGSLIVGTTTARTLASIWKKPLIGVHHTLGHLSSTWLFESEEESSPPQFPVLTLSASGGHTDIWYRTSHTKGTLLGRTLDDAAGEAFDKGASMLGLPYPGGPSIAASAENGNRDAFKFTLPLKGDASFDFSFSGLKTALKYTIRDAEKEGRKLEEFKEDLAASYEHAIGLHLIDRLKNALEMHPETKEIHLVGGVSANQHLRYLTGQLSDITVRSPSKIVFCTDNAAMIAAAAYFLVQEKGKEAYADFKTEASLSLKEVIG